MFSETVQVPESVEAALDALRIAASSRRRIAVQGANTKRQMGGAVREPDVTIATTALNKVIEYEPHDLTVSVEAGCRFADLQRLLAGHRQMVALDPPSAEEATIGGVLATTAAARLWDGSRPGYRDEVCDGGRQAD